MVPQWCYSHSYSVDCERFVGVAEVVVEPVSSWQAAHRHCTVTATVAVCGDLPSVVIEGDQCYSKVGVEDIALVTVSDATGCLHVYLVRAVEGGIHIVVVDPI